MYDRIDSLSLRAVPDETIALYRALHRREPLTDMLGLSDQQWLRLLKFSDLAHLTLPLARMASARLPGWVRDRLDENLKDNRTRFDRVKATYLEAHDCLKNAGVDFLVIKGFTLAPNFVERPWFRQQSDIDIYCGEASMVCGVSSLTSIGYRPDSIQDYRRADHSPTLYRKGSWTWAGNHFDPEMPLSIELHHRLWNEKVTLIDGQEIGRFFARKTLRRIEGMEVPVLQDVDTLGHQAMHILRNMLVHDTVIHHVFELALFLDRKYSDHAFWNLWQSAHSETLRAKEVIAFELARCCFGCKMPEAAADLLEKLPKTQRSWLKRFALMPLELPFRENKDAAWLHLALLQDTHQRGVLLRRTLLPNKIPNAYSDVIVLAGRGESVKKKKSRLQIVLFCFKRLITYSKLNCRTFYHGLIWRLSE